MMKRHYYDMVGGYRKAFCYSQDRDLWLRLIDVCNFDSVDEVLYERIYISNSLRFDMKKVVTQKRYSELARQCAEMRNAGERDLVDSYGVHAIGFLAKSKRLSSLYYDMFLAYLREDADISLECLKLAVNEQFRLLIFLSFHTIHFLGVNKLSALLISNSYAFSKTLRRIKGKAGTLNKKIQNLAQYGS